MFRSLSSAQRFRHLSVVFAGLLAACGGGGSAASPAEGPVTLRLGHFPNITHATALVGIEEGIFARQLGSEARLDVKVFNAGPAAIEALFSDALDAVYIGPNPAINAFVRSKGEAIRIVAGATSGGAFFVVQPEIRRPADLRGKKVASPQLGNTQDVALRTWLASQGMRTDTRGGGDVSIVPQENAQTLETFRAGDVAGAWAPEPWATRLVLEAGGTILVDERDLWPNGTYVTTHLIIRTQFLREHREVVEKLIRGHVEATEFLAGNPKEAQRLANDAIGRIAGKRLGDEVIDGAWKSLAFTNDPVASSLRKSARDAQALGLLPEADLTGIYDVSILNEVLRAAGKEEVAV